MLSRPRELASRFRRHGAVHFSARAIKLTLAILAAAIVASLTIDGNSLGRTVRTLSACATGLEPRISSTVSSSAAPPAKETYPQILS